LPSEEGKGVEQRVTVLSKYRLPEHVVQVLNTKTSTVHLSEGEGTWCKAWRCGSRDDPAATAEFALNSGRWSDQNPVAFCLNCHSIKTVSRFGGALVLDGEPVVASSSSSSESSAAGASE
jgi:hypothetical protein